MCYSVSASDHKYVSLQSLSRGEGVNNSIAITTSCEHKYVVYKLHYRKHWSVFQKRDSEVERRQDMMLAENFIEQGSAVRRSCVCHFTCNRENWDKEMGGKKLQEELRTWKPKDIDSRETQDCKHKVGWRWCGHHWYRKRMWWHLG